MIKKSEILHFVDTIMNQNGVDDRVQQLVQEISETYGSSLIYMIQTLDMKKETITSSLQIIAEEVLSNEVKLSHVLVLLVFCKEIDTYCKHKQYPWYKQDILIHNIVEILWKFKFIPPSLLNSFKICSII